MLHLLPTRRIITIVASANAFAVAYIAYWLSSSATALEPLKYVSIVIFIIDILILLISTFLWRYLWRLVSPLADIYFPDLNGIWKGKIIFENNTTSAKGQLDANVRIRQSFWAIYMDLSSTTSKSYTLLAYPKNESGNKMLYYVYHNTSNNPHYPPFNGACILEVNGSKKALQLQGNYFTDRQALGRIELKRISDNPNDSYELPSAQP